MFCFKPQDQYFRIYSSRVAYVFVWAIMAPVCVCLLTHLRLCSEISCDKVGGKQSDSLVRFPLPPVWVTEIKKQKHQRAESPSSLSLSPFSLDISTQHSLDINIHTSLCLVDKLSPVVQDGDDLSRLESELIVLGGFEVIDGADFPAVRLVRGQQAGGAGVEAGQGGLGLLTLLFQRELDSCAQKDAMRKLKNAEVSSTCPRRPVESCFHLGDVNMATSATWTKPLHLWPSLPPLFCSSRWKGPSPPRPGLLLLALQPLQMKCQISLLT